MEDKKSGDGVETSETHGDGRRRRLIEYFFPSEVVSEQGRRERYQRGKTPHTIFTWWARRPFAAARAVVVTSLLEVDEPDRETTQLVEQYCGNEDPEMIRMALQSRMAGEPKRVLDLFGGGGTIPLEAARLGTKVCSVENNELAHFIQKVLLELSQTGEELARDVRRAGAGLLEDLGEQTEPFFPARDAGEKGTSIAYLYSREVQCEGCGGWLSLMRRPWLSKRSDREWYVHRSPQRDSKDYSIEIRRDGQPADEQSAWDGGEIVCPFCDHRIERDGIGEVMRNNTRDRMVAVCTSEGRRTRTRKKFEKADDEIHQPSAQLLMAELLADLREIGEPLPEAALPRWSGVTNPALYGMARHSELFNLRQRAVLVRLCRLLRQHHRRWEEKYGARRAEAIAGLLSGFVDQLVDWNGRLSTWISQNEQVGRGLSGPGMAMVWDHVEIDPVVEAPANLWDKLERIVTGLRAIPEFEHTPQVVGEDARDLPFDDNSFDVVATDPPYFDNIFYSVLADCIYVWKRLALGEIFDELFGPETTNRARELTMNRHEAGDTEQARRQYTEGMARVLEETRRVMADDAVLSLVFAHGTVEGWASLVEALVEARLKLVAAWPMYVERRDRPRGMSARAVNTSFVLVATKRFGKRQSLTLDEFEERLRDQLQLEDEALDLHDKFGDDTRGRTLFGLGVGLFTELGRVVDGERQLTAVDVVETVADVVEEMVGVEGWGVRRE